MRKADDTQRRLTSVRPAPFMRLSLDDEALDVLAGLIEQRLASRRNERRQSPWLTAAEAAEYLRCPISRVRKLTMTRELPCHRDGRRTLVQRSRARRLHPPRRRSISVTSRSILRATTSLDEPPSPRNKEPVPGPSGHLSQGFPLPRAVAAQRPAARAELPHAHARPPRFKGQVVCRRHSSDVP